MTTSPADGNKKPDRITILLLGSDLREILDAVIQTDTLMVISVEPANRAMILLSIPRDLYVAMPKPYGRERINAAYRIGEEISYSGGGVRMAADILQRLLGIEIDHYFLINFAVFTSIIDTIGLIRVCPPKAIHDDHAPGPYETEITVDFPAGCQDLDSVRLLQYARVRQGAGDDFGRMHRQQEIIRSVLNKALTPASLLKLARQWRPLWRRVRAEMKTDMTFVEICDLLEIIVTVPRENIYSAVPSLRNGLVRNFVTPSKQQVLLASPALPTQVQALFENQVDAPPDNATPPPSDDTIAHQFRGWLVGLKNWAKNTLIAITFRLVRVVGVFIK